MCRTAGIFLLQRLKGRISRDAHDFNNMEPRAVIEFLLIIIIIIFFCKARRRRKFTPFRQSLGENATLYATVKTGWPSLKVMIFPPVMRLVLDDPKQ